MNFRPKVSIIIPVYNGEKYLRESIDSALAQTYDNIEIIVVNDGSKDKTEEIALSYGDKIKYFAKENGGTSTALNLGIKNMTGEYFSWLSHDDLYYPNKIKRQIEELEKLKDKNTIMMTDLDGINEKYEKIYQTDYIQHIKAYPSREKSYIHPIIYNQTHGCTLLIPKVCFDKVGLFDEKQLVAQDFELFYRAFLKFPHKLISEVLVTARDTSQRQGIRSHAKGDEEYSALFIKIIESLSEEDFKLLAQSKADFYLDMQEFFEAAGYTIALDYINKRIFTNLQISSYDLIGNKFNGHELHNFLREEGVDSKQLVQYKESNDINTFCFDFLSQNSIKNLIQQKLFLDSDIIHLHLVHNIFDLNYLPIMTQMKPVVITLHDPFFLGGHCVHHFDCNQWKKHCISCPYLDKDMRIDKDISALNFELKKQAIGNSNITAIVASKWMENKVKESPIWQGKKVYYLPIGINQEIFKKGNTKKVREELGIDEDSKVIMFRADNGAYKGLDIIKKALKKLPKNKKYTIITVGQTGLLDELGENFVHLEYDWIKNDRFLVKLYQASDIFLMPSKQETFGLMAVEAMSCGKTVLAITGKGTAIPEVINSPECGIAVEEENYASKLKQLLNNSKELENRGNKSIEYAQKHYNKEKYISGMIEIYKEVIKSHETSEDIKLIERQLKKVSDNNLIYNTQPIVLPNDNLPIHNDINNPIEVMNSEDPLDQYILIKNPNIVVVTYRKVVFLKLRKKIKRFIMKTFRIKPELNERRKE